MAFEPETLGLSMTGLPLVRDLIHERTGLFYDEGRFDLLGDRLAPLVVRRGFHSFLDFYYLLKYDQRDAAGEWLRVMDALSVPETYFWREMDQVQAFVHTVMPALVRETPVRPIRISSVPCASGEEPLTIAMALDEAGWFDREAIEIHASDASCLAVSKARDGRYRDRAFRALPAALREKYFVERDGGAVPCATLRGRITSWSVANLRSAEDMAAHARNPVIFCRNAFIYFSPSGIRTVTDLLATMMHTPGYLFLGVSESLIHITDRFRIEDVERAVVYVKR